MQCIRVIPQYIGNTEHEHNAHKRVAFLLTIGNPLLLILHRRLDMLCVQKMYQVNKESVDRATDHLFNHNSF